LKIGVFRDIEPCSLAGVDRCFRLTYCVHHQGNGPDDEDSPSYSVPWKPQISQYKLGWSQSIHSHPEDGNCIVCLNVGQLSASNMV
jgi:hypothetical protein